MSQLFKGLLTPFVLALLFVACAEAPEGQKVEAGEAISDNAEATATPENAQVYVIDTENSRINWTGSKPGKQHTGYVMLQEGEIEVAGEDIVDGMFVLDMNTITNEDLEPGKGKEKLEGHLKTGDFFEVEKFPTAKFEVVSIEPVEGNAEATHEITGNLTMRDITKSVVVPAKVEMTESGLMVTTPKFTIDRTEWEVNYNSAVLGTVKDKAIHDEIGLQIQLTGVPQTAAM